MRRNCKGAGGKCQIFCGVDSSSGGCRINASFDCLFSKAIENYSTVQHSHVHINSIFALCIRYTAVQEFKFSIPMQNAFKIVLFSSFGSSEYTVFLSFSLLSCVPVSASLTLPSHCTSASHIRFVDNNFPSSFNCTVD